MTGSIGRKAGVGAIATLLLSGLLAGVSYGGGAGIPEPQVLELVSKGCLTNDDDPETKCRVYRLKDTDGKRSGQIVRFNIPARDVDGNVVGRALVQCTSATSTGKTCTLVLKLQAGPHTELGTITAIGTGLPPSVITGGTGAYLNVGGEIIGHDEPDGFHLTLNLVP